MKVCAVAAAGEGSNNQMRGIILEATKGLGTPVTRQALLRAENGKILYPSEFATKADFRKAVFESVRAYVSQNDAPEFVLLPSNYTGREDNQNIDLLSACVKDAFEMYGANVKTMVVAGTLYPYQNVDYINVGKHLLTETDEKTLAQWPVSAPKVIETLGVPSNISWTSVSISAQMPKTKPVIDYYRQRHATGRKLAVFSLGGKTADDNIRFTIDDARKLMASADLMKLYGYDIVFANGPRTPSDVTDYLFENCDTHGFAFYNSKQVAKTEEDKANFRLYDGKYKEQLAQQLERHGNIYPAILSVCDLGIYTHDSFSYTSDSAVLGIPTAVYTGNEITKQRPDCPKLFKLCRQDGYVMNLTEALETIKARQNPTTRPMLNVTSQIVRAMTTHDEQQFFKNVCKNTNLPKYRTF